MLLLTRAVLATPLVAAALATLLSSNGVAAHIIPLRPRMSDLHSRQITIPTVCVPVCDTLITAIEVRALVGWIPWTELPIVIL